MKNLLFSLNICRPSFEEFHQFSYFSVLNALENLAIIGSRREKTCLQRFAKNTGADQPAHPRSLISAFVIRFLERTISKLATSEISIFSLGGWFESGFVGNPEDRFCRVEAQFISDTQ